MEELKMLHLDYELSLEVFNKCNEFIAKKSCYKNIALALLRYVDKEDKYENIKISFGGFNPVTNIVEDGLFYRHCFFIIDDKVIDPTLILLLKEKGMLTNNNEKIKEIEEKSVYFDIISFDKKKYKYALKKCLGDSSLDKYTMRVLNKAQQDLFSKNIILLG